MSDDVGPRPDPILSTKRTDGGETWLHWSALLCDFCRKQIGWTTTRPDSVRCADCTSK